MNRYIYCHNDQTGNRELFLCIRRSYDSTGRMFHAFQFGVWKDQENHLVEAEINKETDLDRWITLTGIYDPNAGSGQCFQLAVDGSEPVMAGDPCEVHPINGGEMLVGAHDTISNDPSLYRMFKGYIAFVAFYAVAVADNGQAKVTFSADNDNNGYIHSEKKNDTAAVYEWNLKECARRLTYFNPAKFPSNLIISIPADYRKAYLRIRNGGQNWENWKYKFNVTGDNNSVIAIRRDVGTVLI
ncbi:MAG: hypothetical protein LBH00_06085, partial [Planctomycetaceae bacterium]|nr:hypothetical protein [Planctomycetaceae bacterium]